LADVLESTDCHLLIDYCSYGRVSRVVWQIAKARGIPVIGDLVEQKAPTLHRWLNGAAHEQTIRDREILPRLDGIIGISPAWVQWAKAQNLPSVWVPALLDPQELPQRQPNIAPTPRANASTESFTTNGADKPRIGWIGHWNQREHIQTLLHALRQLAVDGTPVALDVVGKVATSRWAKRLVRWVQHDLTLNPLVHFHGFVSESQKRALMDAANLHVLLRSENNETRKLFPTRLPEYLSGGKPVILSACTNFTGTFTHGHDIWFVSPDNRPSDLGCAIKQLVQDRGLADRIGDAGRTRAIEMFSTDRAARDLGVFLRQYDPAA